MKPLSEALGRVYAACSRYLPAGLAPQIVSAATVESFPHLLAQHAESLGDHPFLGLDHRFGRLRKRAPGVKA